MRESRFYGQYPHFIGRCNNHYRGYGKFALLTAWGHKEIIISYTGYETVHSMIVLTSDTVISTMMKAGVSELEAVTVDADRYSSEDVAASSRTGATTLSAKDISMPSR